MKIVILTLPLHSNYGGILQAYALQTALERLGHDVVILQKDRWDVPGRKLWKRYIRRFGRKLLKDWSQEIFIEKRRFREKPIIKQNLDKFVKRHLKTQTISNLLDFNFDSIDAVVVGSDQIWRKPYFTSMWERPIQDAFLYFLKDAKIKKISYAASFGLDNLDEYESAEIEQSKAGVERFSAVSVRENSGIDICSRKLDVKAKQVLDPTMLLTKKDYEFLITGGNINSGELLTYILDSNDDKKAIINKISKTLGYKTFAINHSENDETLPLTERIQPPLENWLQGFRDAKFVITDSFHACVFSIIFNKPFIAIGNALRGMDRFTSLLSQFNLENRLITNSFPSKKWLNEIIKEPNINLENHIDHSMNFLKNNL